MYIDDRGYHILPSKPGQFQEGPVAIQDQKKTFPSRENPTINMVRNFMIASLS